MITRVRLENWKSHLKSEFEFERGTNVLVGVSGSGKTSVMDAICFGLFGTFPLANARSLKLEEVIMQKPIQKENCSVTVEFEYKNKKFEVNRTINQRSSNQATLKENGSLIAGPKPLEVTNRIEEIIDVNYELFTRAIYSEQNQTDFFLKLNPAQRKEKIDDLLMINKYELVRANAVSMQNRLKKNLGDKKNWLKEINKTFDEKELETVQKKILEKKEIILKAQKEKTVLEKNALQVDEKISKLEKSEKEYDFFKELLIKTNARAEELKKHIEETKQILKEKNIKELTESLKNFKNKKEQLAQEQTKLKEKEKTVLKQINDLNQKKGSVQEKMSQKEKQLMELESAKSTCPICNRALQDHLKGEIQKETQQQKKTAEQLLEQLEKDLKESKTNVSEIGETIENKEQEKSNLIQTEIKIAEKLNQAKALEEKQKQLKNLTEETIKITEQIKKMVFSPKDLEEQKKIQTNIKEKIFGFKQEMNSGAEIIEQMQQNEKRLVETKKQLEEIEKHCTQLQGMTQQVAIFVNTLKETQAELRHSLINTVNEAMNDIWQNIYPYTDLESTKIEINELGNYDILVKQKNGPWTRVEGILSGGERSCVALTMRIAISLVLTQNLSWLILDEPTHNLDVNMVFRLSQMMKNHLPELVEQVFIITHDKEMELAANASLYFLEREKDINGPTKPIMQEAR